MSRPFNCSDVFRAIADPQRRRIIDLLRRRDHTPGELIAAIRLSKTSISHHLKALRIAGVVEQHRVGRGRRYILNPAALEPARAWLDRDLPNRRGNAQR